MSGSGSLFPGYKLHKTLGRVSEDHQNPALAAIFVESLPRVVEIIAAFNNTHLVVASFNKYFVGKKSFKRNREASDWMDTLNLVPSPDLEAKSDGPRSRRTSPAGRGSGICTSPTPGGSATAPQAAESEWRLLDGRVVPCRADGDHALVAMFTAVPMPNRPTSGVMAQYMLRFNSSHAVYDPAYHPPTFRRDDASKFPPTEAISVGKKRKEGDVEGEALGRAAEVVEGKKPAKHAKKMQGKPVAASTTTKTRKLRLRSQPNGRVQFQNGKFLL
ncbi:hypothetical protein DFH09DRAFT_1068712 [Mycena vulgaris]|nr:hypothetical protein DFH09DRAFT_1068712 [Mycena vulgaris]